MINTLLLIVMVFFILFYDSERKEAKIKYEYEEATQEYYFWLTYGSIHVMTMRASVLEYDLIQHVLMICTGILGTYYFVDFYINYFG